MIGFHVDIDESSARTDLADRELWPQEKNSRPWASGFHPIRAAVLTDDLKFVPRLPAGRGVLDSRNRFSSVKCRRVESDGQIENAKSLFTGLHWSASFSSRRTRSVAGGCDRRCFSISSVMTASGRFLFSDHERAVAGVLGWLRLCAVVRAVLVLDADFERPFRRANADIHARVPKTPLSRPATVNC